MAQLVVRHLADDVKAGLRRRAARHGRSMEEEVRRILRQAVTGEAAEGAPGLGSRLAVLFEGIGFDGDVAELRGEAVRPAEFGP